MTTTENNHAPNWVQLLLDSDSPVAAFFDRLYKYNFPVYVIGDADPHHPLPVDKQKPRFDGWTFCPEHELDGSHNPSLHLTITDDGKRVLAYCQGGCKNPKKYRTFMGPDLEECNAEFKQKFVGVREGRSFSAAKRVCSLELTEANLNQWNEQIEHGVIETRIEDHTGYTSKGYDVALRKVFWRDKGFGQRWFHRDGGPWKRGIPDYVVRCDFYQLDTVVADDIEVWATEGGKDADRLIELGLRAISFKGEARAKESLNHNVEKLRGKHVVICQDNDVPGATYAGTFANAVHGVAASVRWLPPFEGGKSGYDVTDWLTDGHTRPELEAIAANTEPWRPEDAPAGTDGIAEGDGPGDGQAGTEGSADEDPARKQRILDGATEMAERLEMRKLADEILHRNQSNTENLLLDIDSLLNDDQPEATVGKLTNGQGIFYPGVYNGIFGPGGHGKSWLVVVCMAQDLLAGNHVACFTYELPGKVITYRLRLLGVPENILKSHLHLIKNRAGLGKHALDQILRKTGGIAPTFVALDSIRELLSARPTKGYSETDISKYVIVDMCEPFTEMGSTFVSIDHVGHDNHDRQSGSAAKGLVVQGSMYGINEKLSKKFRRNVPGNIAYELKKDNLSGLPWEEDKLAFNLLVSIADAGPEFSLVDSQGGPVDPKVIELAKRFDAAGVPVDGHNPDLRDKARAEGISGANKLLDAVIMHRKERSKSANDGGEQRVFG